MAEFRVAFIANDYDATVSFFRDVMGCAVLRSFEEGGKGTILTAASGQIEVFSPENDWWEPGVTGAKLAWEVPDADEAHATLQTRGADLDGPPTMQPWGHKNFGVTGPDGWIITLYEIVG